MLRMLDVVSDSFNGGDVTYLAELVGEPPADLPLTPSTGIDVREEPLRAAWARPGGVIAMIAWADGELASIGRPRVGSADRDRRRGTSPRCCVYRRLRAMSGARASRRSSRTKAPSSRWSARTSPRSFRRCWHRTRRRTRCSWTTSPARMTGTRPKSGSSRWFETLVRLQARWATRIDELLDARLPDWRAASLMHLIDALALDQTFARTDGRRARRPRHARREPSGSFRGA